MRTLESIYGDFDGKNISRSICYFKFRIANFIATVIVVKVGNRFFDMGGAGA